MRLSVKSIYGIRAVLALSRENGRIGLDKLSARLKCNRALLNKVLFELSRSGILSSKKGPGGGFRLEKEGVTCLEVACALGERSNGDDFWPDGADEIDFLSSSISASLEIPVSSVAAVNRRVYLDYAATTPLDRRVLSAMMPAMTVYYGNANSIHEIGRTAGGMTDEARRKISSIINCERSEVFFTSGGTEGNNWVIKEASEEIERENGRKTVLVSSIEHPSVYEAAETLLDKGFIVKEIPVVGNGAINHEEYVKMLGKDVALVSVMTANNEIGTVQDIETLCREAHDAGAFFHTDAVQALGCMEIDVKKTGVDYMTFSSHKFYGPKGVGGVYIKKGVPIAPLLSGGLQERSRRGGTVNVPGIVGMAAALELSRRDLTESNEIIMKLRDYFENEIKQRFPGSFVNGGNRIPSNLSVTFPGIRADALLMRLDISGIEASAGSACSAGSVKPSRVLGAIGLSEDDAKSTVRFSLGRFTTAKDIGLALNALDGCLKSLSVVKS